MGKKETKLIFCLLPFVYLGHFVHILSFDNVSALQIGLQTRGTFSIVLGNAALLCNFFLFRWLDFDLIAAATSSKSIDQLQRAG